MKPLHPKGNIIILALFILFASALMGILVSMLMKNFISYNQEITYHHKAYYLAKAGEELALLLSTRAPAPLNYTLEQTNTQNPDQNSPFLTHNFSCPVTTDPDTPCPILMSLRLSIDTNTPMPATLTLPPWRSKIIPLFTLQPSNTLSSILSSQQTKPLTELSFTPSPQIKSHIYTLENGKRYQLISNLDPKHEHTISIWASSDLYPQEMTTITTHAQVHTSSLGKELKIQNKLPDFLLSDNYLDL